MPKKLRLSPDEFAQGMLTYVESYPNEDHYRIVVQAKFGNIDTVAIVDTGSPWCILGPRPASQLDFDYRLTNGRLSQKMIIRGIAYNGWLARLPVSLTAVEGKGITIDATVFIPDAPIESWNYPNFLGLSGFLDPMRFAVDPENNSFYFGALDA